jgi:uncharacterized membrane protein YsdA (DUF1294 family)
MLYLIYYLIGINIIAFIFFGVDKRKAIKNKWRIKESLLLLFSLIGGGIGSLFGIYLFHHKTKKRKFTFGVPFLTVIFITILFLIIWYLPIS